VGTTQDAAATISPETEAAAGASEQGDGVPAADAPAASIEGLDGIKIRRRPFTGPSVHHVGPFQFRLENEGNTPRNILEKIVWDKDVEVWQVRRPSSLCWSIVY
jgi:indole-3-glycerol phosphate synthase